jgi:hypothetical protein
MRSPRQRIGRRPAAYSIPQDFPKLLYHARTGQARKVYSAADEAELGPEWGPPQTDVKFSRQPLIDEGRPERPVLPVDITGDDL